MDQDQRKEWLNSLVTRWEKPLLRLCFAFLCDTALAEDAVPSSFRCLAEVREKQVSVYAEPGKKACGIRPV